MSRKEAAKNIREVEALPRSNQKLRNLMAVFSTDPKQFELLVNNPFLTGIGEVPGNDAYYIATANYEFSHQVTMNPDQFERAEIQKSAEPFAGISLTQEDERWEKMRALINGPLSRRAIPGYLQDIFEIVGKGVNNLAKRDPSEPIPLKHEIQALVGKIACATILGGHEGLEDLTDDIIWIIMTGFTIEGARMMVNKHLKAFAGLTNFIPKGKEYDRRLAVTREKLGQLLDDCDENSNFGILSTFAAEVRAGRITRDVAIRELLGVFAAAFETTTTVVLWSLAELSRKPEYYRQLRGESELVLGNKSMSLAEKMAQLSYATQCFDESARLWPPAWKQLRQPIQDTSVMVEGNQVAIPKDTLIIILTHLLHRDPRVWGDNAAMFDPEHTSPQNLKKIMKAFPGSYIPWNEGKHLCPGMPLSRVEGPLILAEFARRFTFKELRAMFATFPEPVFGTALSPAME